MTRPSPVHPRQRKALSQVFLRDDWPCCKLVDHLLQHRVQTVVEVGPGHGILTRLLLAAGIHVTALEKDERFAARLAEVVEAAKQPGRLNVVTGDALQFDLAKWLATDPASPKAICGNIPYAISSPLLLWLLPHLGGLRCALLMVQLEFGQRLAANPGTKAYGSLSVYTQLRGNASLEFKVARTCFYPVPKVDSVVVALTALLAMESPDVLARVEQLTRQAFTQRRKVLSNSLSVFLKGGVPEELPVDLSRRCDSLSPAEFVLLAKALPAASAT